MEIGNLLQAIETQAWAIDPLAVRPMLRTLLLAADNPPTEEQAKKLTTRQDGAIRNRGSVAVVPLHGPMLQRVGRLEEILFGLTSTERVKQQIQAAAADSTFSAILLHVDSPGGSVYGTRELAQAVREAKASKPVIAQVDSVAASAAYWVASQATEINVTTGGDVGSIGVYYIHEDVSKALDEMGVNVTLISAGKYKTEGNPFEPMDDEARAFMQARADQAHTDFVRAVAEGRGVDASTVRSSYGQGRVVSAKDALSAGMVDRIATTNETVSRFVAPAAEDRGNDDRRRRARLAYAKANAIPK